MAEKWPEFAGDLAIRLDGESQADFVRRLAWQSLKYLSEKCAHDTTVEPVVRYVRRLEREAR